MLVYGMYVGKYILHAVVRFQPSEEDREMYKNYKDGKDKLQSEDQFIMKVRHHLYYTTTVYLATTIKEAIQ